MNGKGYFMVYGGEIEDQATQKFRDPTKIEVVGFYKDYDEAVREWRGAAQRTVDNALMRFFIVEVSNLQKISKDPADA